MGPNRSLMSQFKLGILGRTLKEVLPSACPVFSVHNNNQNDVSLQEMICVNNNNLNDIADPGPEKHKCVLAFYYSYFISSRLRGFRFIQLFYFLLFILDSILFLHLLKNVVVVF